MPLKQIIGSRCAWADRAKRARSGHVWASVEANLFRPLHPATRAEFAAASGDELGLSGSTPKMSSLPSSSALAANVFDQWRGLDLGPIVSAFGLDGRLTEFHFEQRLRHGLASGPPNLDLVFFRETGVPVGVEIKFCEPYDPAEQHPPIDEKYFTDNRARWSECGLSKCQSLAESVGRGEPFHRLGAGQLLKHILGLAYVFGSNTGVHLCYLWFDSGCQEAQEHRTEIARFHARLDSTVHFKALTCQELLSRLRAFAEPAVGYFDYLKDRYGAV